MFVLTHEQAKLVSGGAFGEEALDEMGDLSCSSIYDPMEMIQFRNPVMIAVITGAVAFTVAAIKAIADTMAKGVTTTVTTYECKTEADTLVNTCTKTSVVATEVKSK